MSDLTSQYIIAQEEHDYNKKYEEGTIVKHTIDNVVTAYTAKKNVPQFISILNENYWKKIASTTSSGGGSVDIFNEDVEVSDAQRNKALANVSNQTADSITGKMGYKVLDHTKTFAEQVTAENTVYEIRDVFNLNGSDIIVPSNVTFVFNGGKIVNGTITNSDDSISVENINNGTLTAGVFSNGYNFHGDTLCAENIGMIPNNASKATINNSILSKVVSKKKNIELNKAYYISDTFTIDYDFTIQGTGTIYLTGYFLKPSVNCKITIDGITIKKETSGVVFVIYDGQANYDFDSITFSNCKVYGNIRCADLRLATNGACTIQNITIKDCYFKVSASSFIIPDGVLVKNFVIKSNRLDGLYGTFLWYSNVDNENYRNDELIVEDNIVIGDGVYNNSDYYTFVLAATESFIYRNNYIKNIIGVGTGVTYDSYASSRKYECTNNYFENVCQMPSSGSLNNTVSEIFKSKGNGGTRFGYGNKWYVDFSVARQICADNNITFTDEQFNTINYLNLFGFTSEVDIEFYNNDIVLKNGGLIGNSSSRPIKSLMFKNNTISVDKISSYACFELSKHANTTSYFVFTNNIFKGNHNWFNVSQPTTVNTSKGKFVIKDNVFDKMFFIPYATSESIIQDNICENTTNILDNTKYYLRENYIEFFASNYGEKSPVIEISNKAKGHFYIHEYTRYVIPDNIYLTIDNKFSFHINKTDKQIEDLYGNVLVSGISIEYWSPTLVYTGTDYNVYMSMGGSMFMLFQLVDANNPTNVVIDFSTTNPLDLSSSSRIAAFDNTNKCGIFYDGSGYKDVNGYTVALHKGNTASRPTNLTTDDFGFEYADSDLGKKIMWSGTTWVNLDGTALN